MSKHERSSGTRLGDARRAAGGHAHETARDARRREIAAERARRRARRQRTVGLGLLAVAGAAATLLAVPLGGSNKRAAKTAGRSRGASAAPLQRPSSFAVGIERLTLVDHSRALTLPDGETRPRELQTIVRYPAEGLVSGTDLSGAAPARRWGPFPLIVFGHGFAETPEFYKSLLQAWAHAGFIVAAPVFPLENANAPGGPERGDLINEPQDMRFVISSVLAASALGVGALATMADAEEIAVSGQSDGGDAALAVGFNRNDHDPRVRAVVIFSGAELPNLPGFEFHSGEPPLLATQGSSDTMNLPAETMQFFEAAVAPKYLLEMPGAAHLPPYSSQQPQLGVVEHLSIAFLKAYLQHDQSALRALNRLGNVSGVAHLVAEP